MSEGGFDCRMKLKVLRSMIPDYMRYLVPSKIISDLSPYVLNGDQKREILEKERQSRQEAVRMLMDAVLAKEEDGLSYFIDALKQGNNNCERFLNPLEDTEGSPTVENNTTNANHPEVNKYFAFLTDCLEGDIIRSLCRGELEALMYELLSEQLLDEGDISELRGMSSLQTKAVHLFRMLPQATSQWPLKFFRALNRIKPEVVPKCDLLGDCLYEEVDKEAAALSGAQEEALADSEETLLKTQCTPRDEGRDIAHERHEEEGGHWREEEKEAQRQPSYGARGSDSICDGRGAASSAHTADSDEEQRAHFSDDEKQDIEDSEKSPQGEEPRTDAPKVLALRMYQHELAQEALNGSNTIICAPTGSGKTRVALHIVQKHLEEQAPGRHRKVVFLARTVPLVSQQHRNFKEYLPQYKCELVTGESENSMTMHHLLDKNDILVLTPKILENHLTPEKIPSLSQAFSLIIFDECHHTRKGEPYNSVMKHYLKSKKQGDQGLPQIVGLTASIGVEKATTANEAKESILGIMGNLDVTLISQVRENEEELRELVPRPEEDLETLFFRERDDISNTITNVMNKIVEELLLEGQRVKGDSEADEIHRFLSKRENDLKSQKFAQWAVNLRNQARLLMRPQRPKDEREVKKIMERNVFSWNVQILADWLVAYNEAFDVHDLTRPEDVLHYLERKSHLLREQDKQFISRELDSKLVEYFTDVQRQLKRFSGQKNPNLVKLGKVIMDHIQETENDDKDAFRILVFVRTRATCRALCRWLNSSDVDELRLLNAQHFTGTGAHQEHGGMTAYEQVETLTRFKCGDVKLLVTTSVGEEGIDIAECNLTIRYNHVGNEVTTVQTRGRSRKRGGRSILMAMPKIIEQEELNRKREQLMHAALRLIRAMPEHEIREFVEKVQTKVLEVEEIDQIMKQVKKLKKEADFSIACPQCYNVKVNGAQIRSINNAHRVIIGHDIDKDVVMMPGRTILKKDDWEMRGSVNCKCKKLLGQLLTYKKANFILVSPKYWVFLDKNDTPSVYKKWAQVPHQIAEVSPSDIKKHLGQDDSDSGAEEPGAAAAAGV